ncbi:hypothetical protein PTKIN_Ptkin03bG0191600 [Pterospermum kingtungense]
MPISTSVAMASPEAIKGAYWPSWMTTFPPSAIDTSLFTHIYYAFLMPSDVNYKLKIPSSTALLLSNFIVTDTIPHRFHKTLWNGPIIGALVESRSVAEKGYLKEGYLVLDKVRSECRPKRGRGLLGVEKSPE